MRILFCSDKHGSVEKDHRTGMGGAGGAATDIQIEAEEILKARDRLNRLIAEKTGQPIERVSQDTDRNHWMSPEEAQDYGIVGKIITSAGEL